MSVATLPAAADVPSAALSRGRRLLRAGAALFPDPSGRAFTRTGLAIGSIAVVAGTVISLLRTTGTGALQTIFEEDAIFVLTDALNRPSIKTVFQPLSGYFNVGPRSLGELAVVLPLSWAAAVLSISSAVITVLLAIQIYVASGAHLTNRFARFLVAAPMLFAPAVENRMAEIYNRPVCLHFFAMYALFWVLLWTPSSRIGKFTGLLTAGVTGMSTILIIGYAPLAVVRLALRRTRYSLALAGLVLFGTAAQIGLVTFHSTRSVGSRFDLVWALQSYVGWAMPDSLLGMRATSDLAYHSTNLPPALGRNLGVIILAWLIVAAIVAIAVLGSRLGLLRPAWMLALAAGVHSVWLFVMMVMALGHNTQRYLMPVELLLFAALTLLLLPAEGVDRRKAWAAVAAFTVFLGVVAAFNFRWNDTFRSQSPAWSATIKQASAVCNSQPRLQAVKVRNASAPLTSWAMIPCHELRHSKASCTPPSCLHLEVPAGTGRRE